MELPDFLKVKMFQLIVLINIITNYYTFAVIDDDIQGLKGVQDFSELQNSGESNEFMEIPGFSQAISQYLQSMTLVPSRDLHRDTFGFDEEQNKNNSIKMLFGGLTKDQISSHVIDYVGGEIHTTNNEIMGNGGMAKEQTFDLIFPSKKIAQTERKKYETENVLAKFFDLSSKIGSNVNSDERKSKPLSRVQESNLSQTHNKYNYRKEGGLLQNYEELQNRKKRSLIGGTLQTIGTMVKGILTNVGQGISTLLDGQAGGTGGLTGGTENDDGFQILKGKKDFSEPKDSGESKEFMGIPGFSQAITQYLQSMALERNGDLQRDNVGFVEEQNNKNLIKILFGGLTKDQISSQVIDYVGGEIHITNSEILVNGEMRKWQTFDLVFPSKKVVHTVTKKDENGNNLQKFFDLSSKVGSNLNSEESKNKLVSSAQTSDLPRTDNEYNYRKKRFSLLNNEKAQDRKKRGLVGETFQTLGTIINEVLQIPVPYSTALLGAQAGGGAAGAAGGAGNGAAAGK